MIDENPVKAGEEFAAAEDPLGVAEEDDCTVMDTYWNAYTNPVTGGRSVGTG